MSQRTRQRFNYKQWSKKYLKRALEAKQQLAACRTPPCKKVYQKILKKSQEKALRYHKLSQIPVFKTYGHDESLSKSASFILFIPCDRRYRVLIKVVKNYQKRLNKFRDLIRYINTKCVNWKCRNKYQNKAIFAHASAVKVENWLLSYRKKGRAWARRLNRLLFRNRIYTLPSRSLKFKM